MRGITIEDFQKAIDEFENADIQPGPLVVYTYGTGIPDQVMIDYFKDINIIVQARDGTRWQYGKQIF